MKSCNLRAAHNILLWLFVGMACSSSVLSEERARDGCVRGTSEEGLKARLHAAQNLMSASGVDALVVTQPHYIAYFSNFRSEFFVSPTRPWFLVVPRLGTRPIAVIPEIGEALMRQNGWVADTIHTWPAPRPEDEGVSLLLGTLRSMVSEHGTVAFELGPGEHLRMPVSDFLKMSTDAAASSLSIVDGSSILRALRSVKSDEEVQKIRCACQIQSRAFQHLSSELVVGMSVRDAASRLKALMYELGADEVGYLVANTGRDGYDSIITNPFDVPMLEGDVFMIDTGAVFDGYFCDFDRNFQIGSNLASETAAGHALLYEATEAAIAAAKPGATAGDLANAMSAVLARMPGGGGSAVGRMGHEVGMQITEGSSLISSDTTVLKRGMVFAVEPSLPLSNGKMLVHEEVIVITELGSELLSIRAPSTMWTVMDAQHMFRDASYTLLGLLLPFIAAMKRIWAHSIGVQPADLQPREPMVSHMTQKDLQSRTEDYERLRRSSSACSLAITEKNLRSNPNENWTSDSKEDLVELSCPQFAS